AVDDGHGVRPLPGRVEGRDVRELFGRRGDRGGGRAVEGRVGHRDLPSGRGGEAPILAFRSEAAKRRSWQPRFRVSHSKAVRLLAALVLSALLTLAIVAGVVRIVGGISKPPRMHP